jgi:Fe-S-cluster-containing hydrogenase component 2
MACASRDWAERFPAPSKISVAFFREGGQVPITCFQCDSAPCLSVCKTGALHLNARGVVEVAGEKCVGCRMCVMACPFGNVSYSPAMRRAVKCDQCGGLPRCAAACPSRAIEFVPDEETVRERRHSFAKGLKNALKELA